MADIYPNFTTIQVPDLPSFSGTLSADDTVVAVVNTNKTVKVKWSALISNLPVITDIPDSSTSSGVLKNIAWDNTGIYTYNSSGWVKAPVYNSNWDDLDGDIRFLNVNKQMALTSVQKQNAFLSLGLGPGTSTVPGLISSSSSLLIDPVTGVGTVPFSTNDDPGLVKVIGSVAVGEPPVVTTQSYVDSKFNQIVTYTLPAATDTTLGGIKTSNTILIGVDDVAYVPTATYTRQGVTIFAPLDYDDSEKDRAVNVHLLERYVQDALGTGITIPAATYTKTGGVIPSGSVRLINDTGLIDIRQATTTELGTVTVTPATILNDSSYSNNVVTAQTLRNYITNYGSSYTLPVATSTVIGGVRSSASFVVNASTGIATVPVASSSGRGIVFVSPATTDPTPDTVPSITRATAIATSQATEKANEVAAMRPDGRGINYGLVRTIGTGSTNLVYTKDQIDEIVSSIESGESTTWNGGTVTGAAIFQNLATFNGVATFNSPVTMNYLSVNSEITSGENIIGQKRIKINNDGGLTVNDLLINDVLRKDEVIQLIEEMGTGSGGGGGTWNGGNVTGAANFHNAVSFSAATTFTQAPTSNDTTLGTSLAANKIPNVTQVTSIVGNLSGSVFSGGVVTNGMNYNTAGVAYSDLSEFYQTAAVNVGGSSSLESQWWSYHEDYLATALDGVSPIENLWQKVGSDIVANPAGRKEIQVGDLWVAAYIMGHPHAFGAHLQMFSDVAFYSNVTFKGNTVTFEHEADFAEVYVSTSINLLDGASARITNYSSNVSTIADNNILSKNQVSQLIANSGGGGSWSGGVVPNPTTFSQNPRVANPVGISGLDIYSILTYADSTELFNYITFSDHNIPFGGFIFYDSTKFSNQTQWSAYSENAVPSKKAIEAYVASQGGGSGGGGSWNGGIVTNETTFNNYVYADGGFESYSETKTRGNFLAFGDVYFYSTVLFSGNLPTTFNTNPTIINDTPTYSNSIMTRQQYVNYFYSNAVEWSRVTIDGPLRYGNTTWSGDDNLGWSVWSAYAADTVPAKAAIEAYVASQGGGGGGGTFLRANRADSVDNFFFLNIPAGTWQLNLSAWQSDTDSLVPFSHLFNVASFSLTGDPNVSNNRISSVVGSSLANEADQCDIYAKLYTPGQLGRLYLRPYSADYWSNETFSDGIRQLNMSLILTSDGSQQFINDGIWSQFAQWEITAVKID